MVYFGFGDLETNRKSGHMLEFFHVTYGNNS